MIFKKYKIRRLMIRLVTAAIVLLLIFICLNLLELIFVPTNKEYVAPTPKEKREEHYNTPMVGSEKVKDTKQKEVLKYIDDYYNYCNDKKYEQAYAMLDEQCKEVLFPTIEDFKRRVDSSFDKLKLYRYQNLTNLENKYIYKMSLYDDIMAYGLSEFPTESIYYVTINDKGNNNYTISLNGLIEKTDLNYKVNHNNIQIIVESKEKYYNSTKINYTIMNNSNDIIIVDCDEIQLIEIEKNREKEYSSSTGVLGDNIITIYPGNKISASSRFNISNIYDYIDDRVCFNQIYTLADTREAGDLLEITKEIIKEKHTSKFNMQIPL